ncbi:MAG: FG-GAP repeat protein, partial [Leptospiraceae bacterium]|nr:FG-GAP repeat protein [Leptospiraceae bacterium]
MSVTKQVTFSVILLALSCKGNMEQTEYKARDYPSGPVTPATPIDPHSGNRYGQSVAISGDTMVVGVPYDPSSERGVKHGVAGDANQEANRSGAVYVYRRVGIHWEQEAYLKSSSLSQPEEFGKRVAIS